MIDENVECFRLTPAYCLFNKIAVFEQNGSEIVFMMQDLSNGFLQKKMEKAFLNYLEELKNVCKCPEKFSKKPMISFIQGSPEDLHRCVSKLYNMDCFYSQKETDSVYVEKNEGSVCSVSVLLDSIICDARKVRATDIHIEGNSVRFRVNGVLENHFDLQSGKIIELIERIKMLAGMKNSGKRECQDGRFIYGDESSVLLRVSVVPVLSLFSENAESVVIRLLDIENSPMKICDLGFNFYQMSKIREFECLKNGLILICGPAFSGKSTTIASILTEIKSENDKKRKIISMEDSPKYLLSDISQIQIDERYKNSYEKALNNIFKQDSDVIVIGEIKSEIGASTALRAALTGHLVLATLHCSSAGEAILRLENFGLSRNLVSSVVKGVICQTLEYDGEKKVLYADVAFPSEKFCEKMKPYYSENQIEQLFVHYTNYSQILESTLSSFKEKISKDFEFEKEMDEKNKKMKHQIFIPVDSRGRKTRKRVI